MSETDQPAHEKYVAVAVITVKGVYPAENRYARVERNEEIGRVLDETAEAQGLVKTDDWVVRAHGEELSRDKTYRQLDLQGIIDIEWHKREGGGGA